MKAFILIWVITINGYPSSGTARFSNSAACNTAAEQLKVDLYTRSVRCYPE